MGRRRRNLRQKRGRRRCCFPLPVGGSVCILLIHRQCWTPSKRCTSFRGVRLVVRLTTLRQDLLASTPACCRFRDGWLVDTVNLPVCLPVLPGRRSRWCRCTAVFLPLRYDNKVAKISTYVRTYMCTYYSAWCSIDSTNNNVFYRYGPRSCWSSSRHGFHRPSASPCLARKSLTLSSRSLMLTHFNTMHTPYRKAASVK